MSNVALTSIALPPAALAASETKGPTAEEKAFARKYPAGPVELERTGLKRGLQITGGLAGLGGATLLGISLLSGRAPGSGASRLLMAPLAIGGGLVAAGAGAAFGAELLPPTTKIAVASGLPSRSMAGEFAGKMVGRKYSIEQDVKGKWAVFDEGPLPNTRGYEYGRDRYYGGSDRHHDYYHRHGHYEPYYPGYYDYDVYYPNYPTHLPDPWYPSPSSGRTSRGDDYDYSPSYPSSGGSTSRGDDYAPPSYSTPSYDPPSYSTPSYDPPSYSTPSYDPPSYSTPSYDSSYGNSSSNGNPSYDDF
jgi:hypothetical protein